jgi:CDP-diacylglycerol--glycerol-3-phosphate 3-phosphatidyltransferase
MDILHQSDYLATVALAVITAAAILTYGFRVALKGRVHFDRVEKQGNSVLLGKTLMEVAHWSLEPFARALGAIGVTPNQISWASVAFGLYAGCALAFGHFGLGAVFSAFAAFFDLLDGMLARMQKVDSDAGEVLDAALDRYVEFFFLAGLIIFYREIIYLQILSLLTLLGSFMVSYSTAKAEALRVVPPPGAMRRPERAVYLVIGASLSAVSIPLIEIPRNMLPAVGIPMVVALALVALVSNVSAALRFKAIAKAIRARD